jgi:hypothetical protein
MPPILTATGATTDAEKLHLFFSTPSSTTIKSTDSTSMSALPIPTDYISYTSITPKEQLSKEHATRVISGLLYDQSFFAKITTTIKRTS